MGSQTARARKWPPFGEVDLLLDLKFAWSAVRREWEADAVECLADALAV
jgi:hypothetical protein